MKGPTGHQRNDQVKPDDGANALQQDNRQQQRTGVTEDQDDRHRQHRGIRHQVLVDGARAIGVP